MDDESATPRTTTGDDRLETVLDAAFPDRRVVDVHPAGPSWNDTNRTVRVEFADGEAFCKLSTEGDATRITREGGVLEYVGANVDVRVPTVLARGTASGTGGDVPYLVTAPMTGRHLGHAWAAGDRETRAALARRVGSGLAEIHAAQFDAHGNVVDGDADGLVLDTGSWTDVLVDRIAEMRSLAPETPFEHHYDEVIEAVEANRALLNEAPATLVHGDPAKPNCTWDGDSLGFLDWEMAHVGDPARELHRARDQQIGDDDPHAEAVATALHDGYRERAGALPDGFHGRAPIYDAVRYLGKSGFFTKWVEFLDVSAAEFAHTVRTEMNRRLERIR